MIEGNPILELFVFKNKLNETITSAKIGDSIHAELTIKNIGEIDAIWTYVLLNNYREIYTDAEPLSLYEYSVEFQSNESKTFTIYPWIMTEEPISVDIYLHHYEYAHIFTTNWKQDNEYHIIIKKFDELIEPKENNTLLYLIGGATLLGLIMKFINKE